MIDKSAWVVARNDPRAARVIVDEVAENNVATNAVVTLEMLVSARNADEHRRDRRRLENLAQLDIGYTTEQRALEIQRRLALRGRHRIPVTDLLIAACAEVHGAELLHYDKHFDLIADDSDLRAHWIVPRGSAH